MGEDVHFPFLKEGEEVTPPSFLFGGGDLMNPSPSPYFPAPEWGEVLSSSPCTEAQKSEFPTPQLLLSPSPQSGSDLFSSAM